MIFIDNKYTRIYYQIIEAARTRVVIDGYTEKHHIIPRSIGGNDSKSNLVVLTAREHFVCHWLLSKMTSGSAQRSMGYALKMMTAINKNLIGKRYLPASKIYENIRKQINLLSKGRPCSEETREKIRQGNLKRAPASTETRSKLSAAAKRRKGFTPEGRAKVVESNKSRVWTEEMKQKLRDYNLGKPNTSQKGIPQERLICPHCRLSGGKSAMKRWHFDKCKSLKVNITL